MDKLTIYGLKDPRTGEIRYVGSTVQPLELRLYQHIRQATVKLRKHRRAQWIRELADHGYKPEIVVLEEIPESKRRARERWWAVHLQQEGCDLVNSAPAGVGSTRAYVLDDVAAIVPRMGKESDEALALEFGVTRKAIAYHRRKLGIPAFTAQVRVPPPYMGGWNRVDLPQEIIERIGKEADCKLAREFGLHKEIIARHRREMGLPSWAEENDHPTQFKVGQPHPRWSRQK